MKRIVLYFALLSGILFIVPGTIPIAAAQTSFVSDTFTRQVNGGWGSAEQGGAYTVKGKAATFQVRGAVGTIRLGAKKRQSAYLPSAVTLDSNGVVRVKSNKIPVGGSQFVFLVARRTSNGASYLGRLRLAPDASVRLQAAAYVGGKTVMLGSEVNLPNVKNTRDPIQLRMQVSGTNPTTIRLRAWKAGQAEPTAWQYSVQDSNPALQQAGSIGITVGAAKQVTNRPFTFTFDDYNVTSGGTSAAVTSRIYWGALVEGDAPSPQNMQKGGVFDTFEQRAGKRMSILHWGQPWQMNHKYLRFQAAYFDDVRRHGSIPLLDWGSFNLGSGTTQADFQLKDIYNGAHDAYIKQWALDAKAWGHPFFLRFDWEMNGDWQFPWSEKLNGNQPGDYVKAWRHVHDIFTQNGVKNVTWVWCPNIAGPTTTPMASLYPGDAYVDWTCLDGYNKYSTWLRFDQVFAGKGINWLYNSYQEITTLAPSKPLMLGEVASLEAGDGGAKKAAWIEDALLTQLPLHFPKIRALVWFNWNDGVPALTFPIESSQPSIAAFARGIASDYYAPSQFSELNTSPIPPLQ